MVKLVIYAFIALCAAALLYLPVRRIVTQLLLRFKEGEAAAQIQNSLHDESIDELVEEARQVKNDIERTL